MTKLLDEDIIPTIKSKIITNPSSMLKVYEVTPTSEGVLNVVDSSLPSSPVEGVHFVLRSPTSIDSPKISLNGSTPLEISVQHIASDSPARWALSRITSFNFYEVVYISGAWRCLNTLATIATNDIADGAVTTDKINNKAITDSKLATSGMHLPVFINNLAVTNDTPQGWATALGGKSGYYICYYNQLGKFASQPSQWGFLEVFTDGVAEVSQIWHTQSEAHMLVRAGNASGFYGTWRKIMGLDNAYPVGSIYISATLTTATSVTNAIGGGTWQEVSIGLSSGFHAWKRTA